MTGALLVDKPAGPTSHDIVAFVRRTLKTSRVGHTGTLDPLATGLLLVLVGQATRLAQFLAADEKEYIADVRLGISTPTYDAASLDEAFRLKPEATPSEGGQSGFRLQAEELETVLNRFRGSFLQTPPQFSAKKVAGVAAYEMARRKESVDLKPVPVTVRELQVLDTSDIDHRPSPIGQRDLLRLRVAASAGFYVRSLAHDIGQALGCGAHLEGLRRTRVGRFRVEDALTLDLIEARGAEALVPVNTLLGEMPACELDEAGARRVAHGNPVPADAPPAEGGWHLSGKGASHLFRVVDAAGTLLAVAERRPDGLLHPLVVLG